MLLQVMLSFNILFDYVTAYQEWRPAFVDSSILYQN
jgi:hypothetical protein